MKKTHLHPSSLQFHATVMGLALCLAILQGCGQKAPADQSSSDKAGTEEAVAADSSSTYMQAPDITADANGFIALAQCPTTDKHLKVEVNEDCTTAKIFYDDQLIQTVTDEDQLVAADGDAPVYFLDANFDGLLDIFIGPGQSRTYSALLLWDKSKKEFTRIGTLGDPSLQNFRIHPSTQTIFTGGSNSYCCESYTKGVWENGKIKDQEELTTVTDPEQYADFDVHNQYTLRDANQKELLSDDSSAKLPEIWQGLLKALKAE